MNLVKWARTPKRSLSLSDWAEMFNFGGHSYLMAPTMTLGGDHEDPPRNYESYARQMYMANGIVFACMNARAMLFSEARFQWRQLRSGRPGDLFGNGDLSILERPWANGTTGDLLERAISDHDLAGNFYCARVGSTLTRLHPSWVTTIVGSKSRPTAELGDLDAEVLGYIYKPGGPGGGRDEVVLLREQVAHWSGPVDPTAVWRGMSWLTPVVNEVLADKATTSHKLKFFENGATPNLVVSLDPNVTQEAFERWIAMFEANHEGVAQAYKTLYLGGGADAKVIGSDMKQVDFKATQGAGETRICAAARIPPIVAGFSEGLEAATYSNYGQARRHFADGTLRPMWRDFAAALSTIVNVPVGGELWYDDRDIPFLQEDEKDAADVQSVQAQSIKALTEAGYTPESVIDAITAGDMKRLKHAGLFSVQLQEPGSEKPDPATNGTAPAAGSAPALNGTTEE